MEHPQPLSALRVGSAATVVSLSATGRMRRRFADLGFVSGATVRCLGRSPLGDPSAYLIRGAIVAVRRRDALGILVRSE